MNIHWLIIALLFSLINISSRAQQMKKVLHVNKIKQSDSILFKLQSVDFKRYENKPVGYLLRDSVVQKYSSFYFENEPPGVLYALKLKYTPDVSLLIFVTDYKYLKRFSETLNWSLDDFKKESLDSVVIKVGKY